MRPTSDASKKAAGTFRPAVARPPLGIEIANPEPPTWLSDGARAEWNWLIPELAVSGVLARADKMMLSALCELYAEFGENPRKFSAGKLKELRMMCAELGCSIGSRLKMKAPEGAKPPEAPCKPTNSAGVVDISGLLSSTRRASSQEKLRPVDTSASPAKDS